MAARIIVPRLLHLVARAGQRDLFVLSVFLICIGTAWAVSLAGVSLALGAFLGDYGIHVRFLFAVPAFVAIDAIRYRFTRAVVGFLDRSSMVVNEDRGRFTAAVAALERLERGKCIHVALAILAIVGGLGVLVWSADKFVDGAAATAQHAGMPPLLIGMVVVGFGTSAPEMVVSALAALEGNPGIALGNALRGTGDGQEGLGEEKLIILSF